MPQLDLESDHFSWDDQMWANLSNEIANNSGGDKQTLVPEAEEDKGKKRSQGEANKEKGKGENVEKKDGELSDHDTHIWTERERRKKMRNMFSSLHTLLPQLPPKADKSTIVDEAVSYIKALQATLQRLQKQKLERLQGGPSKCLAHEPSVAATSRLAVLATRETFLADQVASMNGNTNKNNSSALSKASTSISASASHLPATIQTWTSPNVVLNICGNDGHFTVYAPKKPGLFASLCSALENNKIEVVTSHISSDADRCVYMIQARLAKGASDDQFAETVTIEEMCRQAAAEMMMYVG